MSDPTWSSGSAHPRRRSGRHQERCRRAGCGETGAAEVGGSADIDDLRASARVPRWRLDARRSPRGWRRAKHVDAAAGTAGPGPVGAELARRQVVQPHPVLEVADSFAPSPVRHRGQQVRPPGHRDCSSSASLSLACSSLWLSQATKLRFRSATCSSWRTLSHGVVSKVVQSGQDSDGDRVRRHRSDVGAERLRRTSSRTWRRRPPPAAQRLAPDIYTLAATTRTTPGCCWC